MPDLLLGWVKKLRGVHGELLIATRSEDPARFLDLRTARFGRPGEAPEPRALQSVRLHGANLIIQPLGVESAAAAESWIGLEMWVDSASLPPLEPGSYYAWQILGAEVLTRSGERLGRLEDIVSTGGCDLWVVRTREGREHLIPAAAAICASVDLAQGRITVDPPAGLLELDAI